MVSGFLLGVLVLYIYYATGRQDLSIWHTERLSAEVTAEGIGQMSSLQDYVEQEDVLFQQLEEQIFNNRTERLSGPFDRYHSGSWSDRHKLEPNWNGTVQFTVATPKATVLMLHGLSDSPYSMKALAESLHGSGCDVTVLRLPGHGTIPSGLTVVRWQDFTAAVRLAARDLTEKSPPGTPFYIIGYSNGAALAVEYSLAAILGEGVRLPDGLFLISPAITVSSTAALAKWNLLLARLPWLQKLAWLSIVPEYDPYKYNSFPINAGKQIYSLTQHIQGQIKKIDRGDGLIGIPPVVALLSVVDATIPPRGLIDKFMMKLTTNDHKLVLFDVNRVAVDMAMIKDYGQKVVEDMMSGKLPFAVSLLTNRTEKVRNMELREKQANQTVINYVPTDLSWPAGVFSLSHVALPFPSTDPIYGIDSPNDFSLGRLESRGEIDILRVPFANLMRLRCNPFYDIVDQQITGRIISD